MAMKLEAKGVTGMVEVDEHFVVIRRKGVGAKLMYGWTRGEKRIPIDSITAVQFKKPGLSRGYIQFSLAGGIESTRGILAATKDENSVLFSSSHSDEFEAIRRYIESYIGARQAMTRRTHPPAEVPAPALDIVGQLRQLAALREEGILTEEEFTVQKARLLAK